MRRLFETHAHVHDAAFEADRGAMLERARAAGIGRLVAVGCDLADSSRALGVAEEHGLDWSLGIHPHEAKAAPPDIAAAFDEVLQGASRRPVAIGEIGLDYYYDHSPRHVQQAVMRAQLRYARDHGFPVIFHHRDAYDDFLTALREEWRPYMRGVVHCFTGDEAQARTFVGLGLLLGIGGIVTFKPAQALRAAVQAVGIDHIVLETDCPYLAPVPQRGQRNEPAFMVHTAEMVARVLQLPPQHVADRTTATAEALFRPGDATSAT